MLRYNTAGQFIATATTFMGPATARFLHDLADTLGGIVIAADVQSKLLTFGNGSDGARAVAQVVLAGSAMVKEREPFMPSRRQFLKYGAGSALGIGLAASGIPLFRGAQTVVQAAPQQVPNLFDIRGTVPTDPANRTLVVLQLGGGNDGLNTVIPLYIGGDPMWGERLKSPSGVDHVL